MVNTPPESPPQGPPFGPPGGPPMGSRPGPYTAQTDIFTIMRNMMPRFLFVGALYPDVDAVLQKVTGRESWAIEWKEVGTSYEELAKQAEEKGRLATAKQAYFLAAISYHLGHFIIQAPVPPKVDLLTREVDCYRKASRYFDGIMECVEIPCGSATMPGYFWRPAGGGKRPCVLALHGADSTKEEYHTFIEFFVQRGLSALIIDGPGQGETRLFRNVMLRDEEFTKAASQAIDYLQGRPEVDASRIGVAGQCMGGYQALRLAGSDSRVKACYAISPFFRYACWLDSWVPLPIKRSLVYMYGLKDEDELRELVGDINLQEKAGQITCPTLIMHGTRDIFVSNDDAEALAASIKKAPKEFVVYEGAAHALMNLAIAPRLNGADWMTTQLLKS